jgi:hypothetical protein
MQRCAPCTLRDLAIEGNIRTAVSLRGGTREDVRPILVQLVSGNYFSMLCAAAATGRVLGPPDEHSGATGVPAVLSYRFWTRAFANSRSILGATLVIQDKPFVVVGIMPQNFFGTRIDESPGCERDTAVRIAAGSAAQCGCCHVGGGPGLVLELFQKRPFLRKERQRRPDLCRSMQLCMHTRQQQKTRQPRVGLGRLRVAPVHANAAFIRCAGVPYEPRSSARIDGRDRLTVQ